MAPALSKLTTPLTVKGYDSQRAATAEGGILGACCTKVLQVP